MREESSENVGDASRNCGGIDLKRDSQDSVLSKLHNINTNLERLIVLVSIAGGDQDHQIRVLTKHGFSSSEIEDATGIPASTVRARRGKRR